MHIKLHSICLPFLIFCLLILHRHLSLLLSSSGCLWVCEWNLFLKIEKLHFCVALDTPSFLLLLGVSCSYFWILPFSGYSVCLNQCNSYFPLVTSLFQGFFYSSTQLGNKVKNRRSLLSEDICYLLLILQFSPCPLFWTSINYLG